MDCISSWAEEDCSGAVGEMRRGEGVREERSSNVHPGVGQASGGVCGRCVALRHRPIESRPHSAVARRKIAAARRVRWARVKAGKKGE